MQSKNRKIALCFMVMSLCVLSLYFVIHKHTGKRKNEKSMNYFFLSEPITSNEKGLFSIVVTVYNESIPITVAYSENVSFSNLSSIESIPCLNQSPSFINVSGEFKFGNLLDDGHILLPGDLIYQPINEKIKIEKYDSFPLFSIREKDGTLNTVYLKAL